MSSHFVYMGSAFDEDPNDSWEHTLPYTGGDVPGTEIGYSDDAVAELNESALWVRCQLWETAFEEQYTDTGLAQLQSASTRPGLRNLPAQRAPPV
jgi:hypothetical protein